MSAAAAASAITTETVLGDEKCSFQPAETAPALCASDDGLADLMVRVAASPLMGGRLLPADVGEAASAMGPQLMRRVVLWRRMFEVLEDAGDEALTRAVAMAGLAVRDLGPSRSPDAIADAITLGLGAELGSVRLVARLENSEFAGVLQALTGETRARMERFTFGCTGSTEAATVASRWGAARDLLAHIAPPEDSPEASQQQSLSLRIGSLGRDSEAWGTITQVGEMLGHTDLDLEESTFATIDASALAVLSRLLGTATEDGADDQSTSQFVRSALELSGDPRFIWAIAERAVSAATRFRQPLVALVIGCSNQEDSDVGEGQVATFQAVRDLLRCSDFIGLLDPGHFLLVLPGTRMAGARILVERMGRRLEETAATRSDVHACSPHYVYATSLNQETADHPTAQQLVQTALDGLQGLRNGRENKKVGWNTKGLSIFRP